MPYADPEKRKAYNRQYHQDRKETANAKRKQWRIDHLEHSLRVCKEYSRKESSKESRRNRDLAKNGWTVSLFNEAWRSQGGKCALCGEEMLPKGKLGRSVVVDHDHESSKPRQLIHSDCNKAIGLLRDKSDICQMAVEYLKRHGK